MPISRSNEGRDAPATQEFFLPELCLPEALLVLVVLAELLVMVLVLAEPMPIGFDWVRLALTSLYVQWIVLLSAALLCSARAWLARLRPGLAGVLCPGGWVEPGLHRPDRVFFPGRPALG